MPIFWTTFFATGSQRDSGMMLPRNGSRTIESPTRPGRGRIVDLAENDGAADGVRSDLRAGSGITRVRGIQQLRKVALLELRRGHGARVR